MLHIINSFPIPSTFFDNTNYGDIIILTDNAVLAAKQDNIENESFTQKAFTHINLYVRKADLLIRNISCNELFRGVIIIDNAQYENAITQDYMIRSCN